MAGDLAGDLARALDVRCRRPTTSAPSAASRRRDRGADAAGAAGDQRLSSLEPHARRQHIRGARIDLRAGGESRSRSSAAPARSAPAWRCAGRGPGEPVVIGSRAAERAEEAAAQAPRARPRTPRSRASPTSEAATQGRDRLPHRPVPRPVGEPQQPARGAASRARSWSTAPSRSPPRSAARRPARSASGRARPPSRRRRWSPRASPSSPPCTRSAPRPSPTSTPSSTRTSSSAATARPTRRGSRALIELIPGLRAVNAGAARDGADRRAADADADLDQRPLQEPTPGSGSPACPTATTGREAERAAMSVALLAGGTGGAKLAAGMQEVIGADLVGDRQHRPTTSRSLGVHVSPDPDLVTYWLSGEIDEERGWGIRDDTLHRLRAPGQARRARLVRPLRPRPRRPASTGAQFLAEGGTPDRRPGADRARRSASTPRVLPMCEEPVRTRVRHRRAGWRGLQEYLIVDARRGPRSRGSSSRGSPSAAPTAEVARGARRRRGDRDRPLQPGDLDRPDPRRAGHARGDRRRRRAGRRGQPATSPAQVVKGPTERFMRGARPPVDRRRRRLALRGADRRRWSSTRTTRTRPRAGSRPSVLPDADGGRRRAAGARRASARVRRARSAERRR